MKNIAAIALIATLLLAINSRGTAEPSKKPTISGYITDGTNGEALIGATVYVEELKAGTIANVYGFYSLSLSPGEYTIRFSYIGYQPIVKTINIDKNDITTSISLKTGDKQLEEVIVTGEKTNANITRNEMSVEKMNNEQIRKIPALMGEVDLVKAIQLLPGVSTAAEGSSGFSVRGGNIDQNLILLDEANVYNASHMLGFFSVFNNDAIKDVKLYKGDIPSRYGGRLSSVLDIRMNEGNRKDFSGAGGLGVISSRLTLQGPILSEKTSFIASGRRTYADLFLPLSRNEDVKGNKLYFYDLNLKINHKFNDNNRIFLSGYFGRDIFGNQFAQMGYGNGTSTLRWNHLFSKRLFSNLSLVYSNYYYSLGTAEGEDNGFLWEAGLNDLALKYDFIFYATPKLEINYGAESMLHVFQPGYAKGLGESSFGEIRVPINRSVENGAYVGFDYKISQMITVKGGLRTSLFMNYGSDSTFNYDTEGNRINGEEHNGEVYNTYLSWEPRFGVNFVMNEFSSIKASYARTAQFLQMARNSSAGTPLDIWFSASPNVKPQYGDQVALGYFRNFFKDKIRASLEVYYKWMQNTIDFKDHAELLLNEDLEAELRFGKSWAYGAELMVKYQFDKFNGWVSYTYSRSEREIKGVNNDERFLAPYDKPHDVSVVFNYDINDRLSIGGTWVFYTGLPGTFPQGYAGIGNAYIPIYSDRNAERYPDYHRMDLSLTWKNKPLGSKKKFLSDWNLSVYNVYNRHNAWSINFEQDEQNPNKTVAMKTYLFPVLPTVTYNFRF